MAADGMECAMRIHLVLYPTSGGLAAGGGDGRHRLGEALRS